MLSFFLLLGLNAFAHSELPDCEEANRRVLEHTRAVRKRLQELAETHRRSGDVWPIDSARFHTDRDYDEYFGKLMGGAKSFDELFAARKKSGKPTHLLDLFGSGTVTSDLAGLDSSTGVRLNDVKTWDFTDSEGKRRVIEGDVFQLETWKRLRESLKTRKIPAVDIITIRPVGAFTDLEDQLFGVFEGIAPQYKASPQQLEAYRKMFFTVMRRGYDILSADGGEMYVQLPDYGEYGPWFERLRAARVGIAANDRIIKITRTQDSPAKLPQ